MKARTHIKCLCCKERQAVDPRNAGRQKYCAKPGCRKASKAASQRQWNAKPENLDYFRGEQNAARARAWQAANPGYWRERKATWARKREVLQETLATQTVEAQVVEPSLLEVVLQDVCPAQLPLFVGILAFLSGLVLQEDIALLVRSLLSRGEDILRMSPGRPPPPHHENENHPVSGATPACATPVQLD
jgi:hypothetical protein